MANQRISLHNTPQFYLQYVKNWLAHEKKKPTANPAEIAIVTDLATLVEIAVGVLEPEPAEPETK